MLKMLKEVISKIGINRGTKRIWCEGKKLNLAGFHAGMNYNLEIDKKNRKLVLTTSENGTYKVSKKRGDVPVLDLTKSWIDEVFRGEKVSIKIYEGRVVITEAFQESISINSKEKYSNPKHLVAMEFFAGGGTLAKAAHDSEFRIDLALELDSSYAESFEKNFPNTTMLNASMTDIAMELLPKQCDLFIAGIPCDTYSVARRNVKGKSKEDRIGEHKNVASVFYVLEAIRKSRPKSILIEEVKPFADSMQCAILINVLKDHGYHISETVVAPNNEVSKRERYALFASLKEGFEWPSFDYSVDDTVEDIFFKEKPDRDWFDEDSATMKREFAYLEKHKRKGNGFGFVPVTPTSERVPTLTKDYAKFRSEFYITDNMKRFRPCGVKEAKRMHGMPNDFLLPESYTKAMQVLGQGVLYRPFKLIFETIKNFLLEDQVRSNQYLRS